MQFFNSRISEICDRCEELPSNVSCHQCRASLCKECSLFIHADGVYARHVLSNCSQLINSFDFNEICSAHKLPLKFFCEKDWIPLCRRCKDSHANHSPATIEEVFHAKVEEFQEKIEGFDRMATQVNSNLNRCRTFLNNLNDNYDLSKTNLQKKFHQLKQSLDWKQEEILREIEVIYKRKQIEISYFLDPLEKTKEKLEEISKFLSTLKNLSPSSVLSNLSYISHLISQASHSDPVLFPGSKINFPVKFEIQALQSQIDSLIISDDALSINSSVLNTSSLPSTTPSIIKSPQLRIKTSEKPSSTTPVKSRSNSRESIQGNLEENPLEPRLFKKKLQSATAIQVSWTHPPRAVQGLNYHLEYGVGMKLNNVEQFRQVYKGTAHTCIITDLLPKTSYRFRVAAALAETKGDWSEVVTVPTFDYQKIDPGSFAAHASEVLRGQEKFLQFDKPGLVLAANPYSFGRYAWEVKIFNNALSPADGKVLRIGVCAAKSKVVHGIDVEFQVLRGNAKVKVKLDVEGRALNVVNSWNGSESNFSLPDGPLIPAVQYKNNKNCTAPVRLVIDFDVDYSEAIA
jgi:hypothetical protein